MQSGEYIVDRWLVRAVRSICDDHSITLRSFSDDWILELKKDQIVKRICGYKFALNDSAAATIAQDKVAAYEVLRADGVAAVEHILIRTKATKANWPNDIWPNGIVLKPLTGTSGHRVQAFGGVDDAKIAIRDSTIEAWAISPKLDIIRETRLIMLDGQVLLAYDKQPVVIDGLKMFNLGKGATPVVVDAVGMKKDLAIQAMDALGLRLASVDVIETVAGETMILEVNDGIMMEYFSKVSGEYERIARGVYETIITTMIG